MKTHFHNLLCEDSSTFPLKFTVSVNILLLEHSQTLNTKGKQTVKVKHFLKPSPWRYICENCVQHSLSSGEEMLTVLGVTDMAISLGELIELSLSIFGVRCLKWMVYVLWVGIVCNLSRGKMGDLEAQRTILNHVPDNNAHLKQKWLSWGISMGQLMQIPHPHIFEAMPWGVGHWLLIICYMRPRLRPKLYKGRDCGNL